jgi:hypothetical protein
MFFASPEDLSLGPGTGPASRGLTWTLVACLDSKFGCLVIMIGHLIKLTRAFQRQSRSNRAGIPPDYRVDIALSLWHPRLRAHRLQVLDTYYGGRLLGFLYQRA